MTQIKIKIKKKELSPNTAKDVSSEENRRERQSFRLNHSSILIFLLTLLIIIIIFVIWLINLGRLFDFDFQKDQLGQILKGTFEEMEDFSKDFKFNSSQIYSQPTKTLNQEQVELLKEKILEEININNDQTNEKYEK